MSACAQIHLTLLGSDEFTEAAARNAVEHDALGIGADRRRHLSKDVADDEGDCGSDRQSLHHETTLRVGRRRLARACHVAGAHRRVRTANTALATPKQANAPSA
jgi:hypothetical protein